VELRLHDGSIRTEPVSFAQRTLSSAEWCVHIQGGTSSLGHSWRMTHERYAENDHPDWQEIIVDGRQLLASQAFF
jgi:hypothetical protein